MDLKFIRNTLFTFLLLFLLLVVIQAISNPLFLLEEIHYHYELFDLRGVAKGSAFLLTYFLAVFVFLLIIGVKSLRIFFFLLLLIFVALSVDFFVQLLGVSHGFSIDEYTLAMSEMGNYKYLGAYLDLIVKSLFYALLVSIILYAIREKIYNSRFSTRSLLILILPMSIIFFACYKVDTFKLSSYPALVKIPTIALEYFRNSKPIKERVLDVTVQPTTVQKFKNIIWIIDESVTGTYLSINGYEKETTPYLKALDAKSNILSNFGVVNSISNCSSKSNLFLRIGMQAEGRVNVKKKMFKLPTIFQYAKRAGYITWLFDSQTQKDHLQNYLTLYDKNSIDHFETLGTEVNRERRDLVLLNQVASIVNSKDEIKNFIVLVKYGAHFPYLTTYDHKESPFLPALSIAYGGMNMEHKEEQVNTYLNSIYSTVDLYLKHLVEQFDLSKSVVFYTSDHGQNILESENLSRTHCNNEGVVRNEVSVPLLVFQKDAKKLFPVKRERFYSQIQIFPTTLSLLGYEKNILDAYGKTLNQSFERSEQRQYTLSSSLENKRY
jgi:glucan phosphoethanolaminetransferase (alkaline phosphatase superfamily)